MLIDNLFYRLKVQKAYEDYCRNHGQQNPQPMRPGPPQPDTATQRPTRKTVNTDKLQSEMWLYATGGLTLHE